MYQHPAMTLMKHHASAVASTLAFLLLTGSAFCSEGPLWEWPGRDGKVVDVVAHADGTATLLFQQRGPYRWLSEDSELEPLGLEKDNDKAWVGMCRGNPDRDDLVIVGRRGGAMCARAMRGGKWRSRGEVATVLENPFCYQSRTGATWLHSWDGALCRFEDGEWETYEYAQRVVSRGSRTYYQRLCVAESDGGVLCFVTNFGSKGSGKAMQDILVRQGGEWSKIPLGKLHPGGACFTDTGALMLVTEAGLFEVDPVAGSKLKKVAELPGPSEIFERPVFMKRLADGRLITIWTRKQAGWSGAPAYEDGSFSKIAEYDGKGWTLVDVIADKAGWDTYNIARPSVEDSTGTLWLGVAGGIMFRKPDGTWGHLGWRDGVAATKPTRLVPAPGRKLWVVDQSGACILIDTRKEPVDEKAETPWSELVVRCELREGPDGILYGVSDAEGGSILKLGPQGQALEPIPATLKFRSEKLYYMSSDSEGGIWVFGGLSQRKTLYFDGTEWHAYTPNSDQGLPYHHKEIAFHAQLGRGSDYRIGRPEDQYYVQYTKDNRILYQNEWRRACYFDGAQWHAPYGADEVGDSTLSDHPFFHDGKVTIHVSGKCYQMENDAWSKETDDRSGRAWKQVDMIPHPFSKKKASNRRELDMPAGCPIPGPKQLWKLRSDGWAWVGGDSVVACSPGNGWLTVPLGSSPLAGVRRVRNIHSTTSGQWLFQIEGSRPYKYAVYQTRVLAVESGRVHLGKAERPFKAFELPWKADRNVDDLLQRYRMDDGEWSKLQPAEAVETGVLYAKGEHRIDVELFGKEELVRSPALTYTFDVTYDAKTMVGDLIAELGTTSFREREQATDALIRFGHSVIPQLRAAMHTKDPEVRMRLKRVLKALEDVETD
jgi:hypothetical protein